MPVASQLRSFSTIWMSAQVSLLGVKRKWRRKAKMTQLRHQPAFHVAVAKPASTPIKALD
jgi:hypothetical protein